MKRFIPYVFLFIAAAMAIKSLRLPKSHGEFDTEGFGRLPILVNGRIKPLDTVARTTLLLLQSKQTVKHPDAPDMTAMEMMSDIFFNHGKKYHAAYPTPDEWLLDVFYRPEVADNYKDIRIVNLEALALFGLTEADGNHLRYSFNQLRPGLQELERQADLASETDSGARTAFQREVVKLRERLMIYHRLKHSMQLPDSPDFLGELLAFQQALPAGVAAARAKQGGSEVNKADFDRILEFANRWDFMSSLAYVRPIPPPEGSEASADWMNMGQALQQSFQTQQLDPYVMAYAGLGHAYRNNQPDQFNEILRLHTGILDKRFAHQLDRSAVEFRFNHAQPFYQSSVLLVLAFLLAVISWLRWPDILSRSAFWVAFVALLLATAGIFTRMWLEGRPPVTNLYSSALFVGWAALLLGLILERIFKNGVGAVVGSAIGFGSLLIAHHLSFEGDTMEMMRAVLDDNFWLATHVVVITIGYSATFLAGFLAIIYIARGALTKGLDKPTADTLTRMVYGIVCFATLFSLVGTILGGIWADQSWGRFWGWDPKENGALLIVLWNAVILHCRWGGLVKQRGMMNLAVFGNIVTAASWFGVNMLGVGLHSYGFMDAAFMWLMIFWASQLAVIAVGLIPLEKWRSFRTTTPPPVPSGRPAHAK